MSENPKQALTELAAHNQITVVADLDHLNQQIPESLRVQIPELARRGVAHLFLEHDARDVGVGDVLQQNNAYAALAREARAHGIEIHLMDDRSRQRERASRYPEEQAYIEAHDVYRENPEALIAGAPSPERMRAYLNEQMQNKDADLEFRNIRMVENIADTMVRHPSEKAIVLVGAAHVLELQDMDEGLRLRGLQTTTAQIYAPDIPVETLGSAVTAPDKSDVIVSAETGAAISYKIPETNRMLSVARMPDSAEIPWTNQEPVADRNHPFMLCALDAAKGVDCSWNHGASAAPVEANRAETGQIAAPSGPRAPVGPEANGPIR